MNKKRLCVLLVATIIGALITFRFLDTDHGYLWTIPVGLGLLSWYLMWLLVKQPKTKAKTLNFRKGDVLFIYDNKRSA